MMRLQTFFALLLIGYVSSVQNGLLNEIKTLIEDSETCKTEVEALKTEVETCKTELETLKTSGGEYLYIHSNTTVESQFKKEFQFKKDCRYNQFFTT